MSTATKRNIEVREGAALKANIPSGSLDRKWDTYKAGIKVVNPANKRKYTVLVVGTGLAGASAAEVRERSQKQAEIIHRDDLVVL